jgi:hypothetical protein
LLAICTSKIFRTTSSPLQYALRSSSTHPPAQHAPRQTKIPLSGPTPVLKTSSRGLTSPVLTLKCE